MNILSFFHKRISFCNRLRGFFFQTFILGKSFTNLRLSKNVQIWGKLKLGKNIFIGLNSKIYTDNTIGNEVIIGDNVELRCNGGNKINISNKVTINRGTIIIGNVTIGENCLIAPMCILAGSNHVFSDSSLPINQQGIKSKGIIIGNNVWLGANVLVLDGVNIGQNSIIGAGSVVLKDIPSNVLAVGNPCKVIKTRE